MTLSTDLGNPATDNTAYDALYYAINGENWTLIGASSEPNIVLNNVNTIKFGNGVNGEFSGAGHFVIQSVGYTTELHRRDITSNLSITADTTYTIWFELEGPVDPIDPDIPIEII